MTIVLLDISLVNNLSYADDSLIYSIGNNWNEMRRNVEHGLESFSNWCTQNRLKLNIKKSKSLLIGWYQKIDNIDLTLHQIP